MYIYSVFMLQYVQFPNAFGQAFLMYIIYKNYMQCIRRLQVTPCYPFRAEPCCSMLAQMHLRHIRPCCVYAYLNRGKRSSYFPREKHLQHDYHLPLDSGRA